MRRYMIIGSGAAGIAAVEAIRSQDADGKITLLCDESDGYYSRPGLAYFLSGEVPEKMLFPFTDEDFRHLNVQRVTGRAVMIHTQAHQVELENEAILLYDRLLIATGATAVWMQIPGINSDGVVKLDTIADTRYILKTARKAHSAVVVGGGIIALEVVEGLVAKGVKVHYFLRGDRYWSNVLDETESRIVEHRLREDGVQIYYQTELVEVFNKQGKVVGVRTKDGRQLKCEIVAIAIGVQPKKQLGEASGLKCDRGILANEYLQTSDPDVYAAGDVAQVYDPFSGKAMLDTLWGTAREQGTIAGLNMSGKRMPYHKRVPFNVTRLGRLTTTIIGSVGGGKDEDMVGITRGGSETWHQLPDAIAAQADFEVNRLRIMVGEQTIVGAVIMGDQTLSFPLQQMIARRMDITSIHEQLLQPGAPLANLIVNFWTQWKEQHADDSGK